MSKYNPERRTVLRGLVAVGCGLCVPIVLTAESASGAEKPGGATGGKMSKTQAKYQNQPKGDQNCATCINFIAATSTCKVVEGQVSASGWCMLWAKKPA
jgi:hypothetical protein